MEAFGALAFLCVLAAILGALLRRTAPETGILLFLGAAAVAALRFAAPLGQIAEWTGGVLAGAGLAPETFAPLLKTMLIAVAARLGAALCTDAGASSLAAVIELSGTLAAVLVSLPLLQAVLELLEGWI